MFLGYVQFWPGDVVFHYFLDVFILGLELLRISSIERSQHVPVDVCFVLSVPVYVLVDFIGAWVGILCRTGTNYSPKQPRFLAYGGRILQLLISKCRQSMRQLTWIDSFNFLL